MFSSRSVNFGKEKSVDGDNKPDIKISELEGYKSGSNFVQQE